MKRITRPALLALSSSVFALCAVPITSFAQQNQGAEEIEEITVSGLRGRPRSAVDSAVPIDTFDASAIEAVSHTDTQDILQTLVPSYNVAREPISDGLTFIRQAELRGLPAHHTLVLVNGKRRHRAALVELGGDGSQGPDVATIPSTAIQSIEVLRDGASSQYGSDAIAGVINFNLKNNSDGFTLQGSTGQYFEGDGTDYNVSANVGLPLGQDGFLSISGEYYTADITERNEQYCESWHCLTPSDPRFAQSPQTNQDFVNGVQTPAAQIIADGMAYNASEAAYLNQLQTAYPAGVPFASVEGDVAQPWGVPNLESFRMFYNAGIELDNGAELYSFGNYSVSEGDGGFFHRYPDNGTIETVRNADGSYWNPLEFFPGGFTPRFEGEVTDISAAAGYRGVTSNEFSYDFSVRYGTDEIDYRMFNTFNPSLGPTSTTDFKPGTLTNTEIQFQIDLSNEFDIGAASPLVFAYGLSYMDEEYEVGQSKDPFSYESGPYALRDPFGFCDAAGNPTTVAGGGAFTSWNGVNAVAGTDVPDLDCSGAVSGAVTDAAFQVVGVGANGFPGYSPEFSDDFTRDSYAAYVDLSADVTDRLFLQAAVRFEDYSDFGNETVGKIAGRFLVTDAFAIRGSIGTGFRAPTPGQQGTVNVATTLPNGFPVATGTFPASGPVAQALGASDLKPETSTNYTFGFTADLEKLSLTVDFYQIEIDDRFRSISTRDVSSIPPGVAGHDPDAYANFLALDAAGVAGANSIGGVRWFTNAFDSETRGVDVVASYPIEWANSTTDVQLAFNWNESEFAGEAPAEFFNNEDQHAFENYDPNTRWNLTANHTMGDFGIMGRVRYFGEWENAQASSNVITGIQEYGGTTFFDLEASYQINDNWRVVVGGRNLFDEYPDRIDRSIVGADECCGRIYSSGTVVPWQGGYYYGRVSVGF